MTRLAKLLATALAAASCCTLLSGCQTASKAWDAAAAWTPTFLHPYRPDVHQGNLVTSEMLSQLEKGMSPEQVQFLLGRPLLQDAFHKDRWDYVYYLNKRSGEAETRKLTIYFGKDGRVDHWDADQMPTETTADLLILGDKAAVEASEAEKAAAARAKAEGEARKAAEAKKE